MKYINLLFSLLIGLVLSPILCFCIALFSFISFWIGYYHEAVSVFRPNKEAPKDDSVWGRHIARLEGTKKSSD